MQKTQETRVQSLNQEDPLEEEVATHSSVPAWKSHEQRSLVGYSPYGHKESDMTVHKAQYTGWFWRSNEKMQTKEFCKLPS